MPVITTGGGGNNGVGEFIAALRAGRDDARAREEARRREQAYQQDLSLAQMQIESLDAERQLGGLWAQGMGEQAQLGQAKDSLPAMQGAAQAVGGPMGALLKMRNEGVGQAPEEHVTLNYLMSRFPQGIELMSRLTGDSRRQFVRDVTQTAAAQMEAEQYQEALERAQAAGIDPTMLQGKGTEEINRAVDGMYTQEAQLQTRQAKTENYLAELETIFGSLGDQLPEEILVRFNALRNEIARRPGADYSYKLSQLESSAEMALGLTEGSIRGAMQLGAGGSGGGRGSTGGSAPRSAGGAAPSGGSQGAAQQGGPPPTGGQPFSMPEAEHARLVQDAATKFAFGATEITGESLRAWKEENGLPDEVALPILTEALSEQMREKAASDAQSKAKTETEQRKAGRLTSSESPGTRRVRSKVESIDRAEGLLKEYKALGERPGRGKGLSPRQAQILEEMRKLPPDMLERFPEIADIVRSATEPTAGPIQGMPG